MPGIHHLHKRKRIHQQYQKYPHPIKWIRWFDSFLFIVAVIAPLVAIPQLMKVYVLQEVAGLSLITWSFYCVGNIPWVIYGFIHKAKPVMLAHGLWFLVNLCMVIGILIYG